MDQLARDISDTMGNAIGDVLAEDSDVGRMFRERLNVPMDSKLAAQKMKCPNCGAQRLISPSGLLCENFDCGGVEPLTHRERVELRSRYHHRILGK